MTSPTSHYLGHFAAFVDAYRMEVNKLCREGELQGGAGPTAASSTSVVLAPSPDRGAAGRPLEPGSPAPDPDDSDDSADSGRVSLKQHIHPDVKRAVKHERLGEGQLSLTEQKLARKTQVGRYAGPSALVCLLVYKVLHSSRLKKATVLLGGVPSLWGVGFSLHNRFSYLDLERDQVVDKVRKKAQKCDRLASFVRELASRVMVCEEPDKPAPIDEEDKPMASPGEPGSSDGEEVERSWREKAQAKVQEYWGQVKPHIAPWYRAAQHLVLDHYFRLVKVSEHEKTRSLRPSDIATYRLFGEGMIAQQSALREEHERSDFRTPLDLTANYLFSHMGKAVLECDEEYRKVCRQLDRQLLQDMKSGADSAARYGAFTKWRAERGAVRDDYHYVIGLIEMDFKTLQKVGLMEHKLLCADGGIYPPSTD